MTVCRRGGVKIIQKRLLPFRPDPSTFASVADGATEKGDTHYMAHQIEIVGGVAKFAYVGQRAWHGLGQELQPGATPDEMKKAAGLDWRVVERPLFVQNADGSFSKIDSHKQIARETDLAQFSVAGKDWTPTQNDEFFAFCNRFVEGSDRFVETAGALRGGKTPFALVNLGKEFSVGKPSDKVRNYLLLSWSHMVGRANRAKFVNERVVCANTEAMALGEDGAEYTQTHASSFDFAAVGDLVEIAMQKIGQQEADYNKLTTLKMNQFDIVKFLQPMLQPMTAAELEAANLNEAKFLEELTAGVGRNKAMEEVLDSIQTAPGAEPGASQTGWGVFNGMTYYTSHRVGRVQDARLTSAWFGDRAKLVGATKKGLLQMAA